MPDTPLPADEKERSPHDAPFPVMLVDDEKAFADTLAFRLQARGIPVLVAYRGEDALAALERPELEVILLDLNMPLKDGRDVLAELKSDAGLRAIPVLVLSTSDADRDIAASYGLGANCYLQKPLGLDDFLQVVKSVENFWLTLVKLPPRDV